MKKSLPPRESILQSLAKGDMQVLDQLYDAYRDDFLTWARQKVSGVKRDDLLDAWHDTLIMFYEQIRDKKLTELTCEVKTFLFLIGYRRLLKIHKISSRTDLQEEFDANIHMEESINALESEELEETRKSLLTQAVEELPEQSRKILVMRYVEGKSVPEIMQVIGYTSVNAVSVTLSRSLKKLKDTIGEHKQLKAEWKKEIRS